MANILTGLVVIAVAFIGFMTLKGDDIRYSDLPEFARCIADKDIVMYGAEWSPETRDQKDLFGDAWPQVRSVECTKNSDLCQRFAIDVYPTWLFATGDRIRGMQDLAALSAATGCPLHRL